MCYITVLLPWNTKRKPCVLAGHISNINKQTYKQNKAKKTTTLKTQLKKESTNLPNQQIKKQLAKQNKNKPRKKVWN